MRPQAIRPMLGPMDTSSTPDEIKAGTWRFLRNMGVTKRKQMCFIHGFEKHLSTSVYNNQDLHDQLFGNGREPITFLYQAITSNGSRRLFAGTSNRLYVLNNSSGNWLIVSDQLGEGLAGNCTDIGWSVGQVKNTLIFSNGNDTPVAHVIDQAQETDLQSVFAIKDLDVIALTKAEVVCSFRGFIIMANVVMDGQRVSHRVVWSDVERPLAWRPLKDQSAAGYQDLGFGEAIIAMQPMNNSLMIYTIKGVWEASADATTGLTFRQRFYDPTGSTCIAYRHTLVSVGEEHYYMGRDAIYKYSMYSPSPEAVDWMFKASSTIYDNIDTDCNIPCGGYDADRKAIWFSWGIEGESCPSRSMMFHPEYKFSSFIDVGFTAFCNFGADSYLTVRDWALQTCSCTAAELSNLGMGFIKEGGYCINPPDPVCATRPANIYSSTPLVIDDVTVEDYTQEEADDDALCALIHESCLTEQNSCSTGQKFIGVYTNDKCIKQFTEVFYREVCTTFSSCSTYTNQQYEYLIRSGPLDLGDPARQKLVQRVELSAHSPTPAGNIQFRYGVSYEAADPNDDRCNLVWHDQPPKALQCQSNRTMAQFKSQNVRPSDTIHWPVYYENRYHFLELSGHVNGVNATFAALTPFVLARSF